MDDLGVDIELDKDETGSVRGVILRIVSPSRQRAVAVFMSRAEASDLSDGLAAAAAEVAADA